MGKLTEDKIELFSINLLETLGYEYKHGGIIAPGGENQEREAYSDVNTVRLILKPCCK